MLKEVSPGFNPGLSPEVSTTDGEDCSEMVPPGVDDGRVLLVVIGVVIDAESKTVSRVVFATVEDISLSFELTDEKSNIASPIPSIDVLGKALGEVVFGAMSPIVGLTV